MIVKRDRRSVIRLKDGVIVKVDLVGRAIRNSQPARHAQMEDYDRSIVEMGQDVLCPTINPRDSPTLDRIYETLGNWNPQIRPAQRNPLD